MISPYLEAGLSRGDERLNPMSAALRLPTLAATAWHHDRTAGVDRTEAARDAFLAEVERFAMSDYLPTLALGTAADPSARERVFTRVAAVTGLPLERVRRSEGRIDRELFVKEGLPGHVLGRYDAAVALPDAAPGEARAGDPDPSATLFGAALAAAVNVQLRETLRAQREPPYVLFNGEANRRWDWKRDNGSAAQLRAGMIANPALKVLIAHGRFDLVTPYFVSTHVARQLALPEAQRANIELALLDGGHMMYFHRASRERLSETARGFYARLAEGAR